MVVFLEPKARRTDDGIEILPAATSFNASGEASSSEGRIEVAGSSTLSRGSTGADQRYTCPHLASLGCNETTRTPRATGSGDERSVDCRSSKVPDSLHFLRPRERCFPFRGRGGLSQDPRRKFGTALAESHSVVDERGEGR